MRSLRRGATVWALIALVPGLMLGAGYVGQVVTPGVSLDGVDAPVGTTVFPGTVIETDENAALIQLARGGVLRVEQSSSAVFTREGEALRLAVLAGAAGYLEGGDGVVFDTGDDADPSEDGGPGEGVPVPPGDPDEKIALCVLRDPTPRLVKLCNIEEPDNREDCKWYRKKVERRDLPAYFAQGAVYADKDLRTPGMNPEVECRRGLIVPWAAFGGAAATVFVLADDDDGGGGLPPVSPIVP